MNHNTPTIRIFESNYFKYEHKADQMKLESEALAAAAVAEPPSESNSYF